MAVRDERGQVIGYGGLSLEETPYRVDFITATADAATNRITFTDLIDRQTVRGVTGVIAFPFSQSSRLELSTGAHALSFAVQRATTVRARPSRRCDPRSR